ncbi:MAG TPA: cytochrome c biogenesis protein CcsA [Dehalococcoidia bacterium]|nr:cytochrome c biogenesis protein CcsA [Dehalococcoidia bacterium]
MSLAASMTARAYGLRWVVLPPLTGVMMMAMLLGAVLVAPREVVEGEVQRLFYIHVPSILAAYLSFFIVFVASILVLVRRDMRFDPVARSAAGVGVLFTALGLVTGAIWGKPIWGVYWTWDARLTSTLVLLLIYSGYLLARGIAGRADEQSARYAAVFAIIGFVDVPLIHFAVDWWRTLHPQPIVARGALPGEMMLVFLIGTVAITLLALWLIVLRTALESMSARTESLSAELDRFEVG